MTIDEIRAEMCNHFCWNAPYASDDNLFCKTCQMDDLPRWIPVTVKVPEDQGDQVLFIEMEYFDGVPNPKYHIGQRYNGHWYATDDEDKVKDVVAWMPLPPYQNDTMGEMIKESWDDYHDSRSAYRYTGD